LRRRELDLAHRLGAEQEQAKRAEPRRDSGEPIAPSQEMKMGALYRHGIRSCSYRGVGQSNVSAFPQGWGGTAMETIHQQPGTSVESTGLYAAKGLGSDYSGCDEADFLALRTTGK
jgi:hypothetical protein